MKDIKLFQDKIIKNDFSFNTKSCLSLINQNNLNDNKQYLDKLIRLRDKKIIKVVTGVRRCGKSTLLKQFEQYLLENGVVEEQIISIIFCNIIYIF